MIKEWKQLKCSICGGELEEKAGKLICKYCRAVYECVERICEDEVIRLNRANSYKNRWLFDDANEEYDLLLKDYPNNPEAAWGAFLCSYGIIYEKDYNGKYKPTCHRLNECPVEKSPYYSKLSEKAKLRAKEIETLRQSILTQAKSIPPYDVFICYKATDEWHGKGLPTKEAQWARDICDMLTRMGLKVFFAEKCLSGSNTDYEPHIYSALQSAKLMLVLTSSLEHLNAVWVQNEWRRYAKYIREGQKKIIRVIYETLDPYMLPRILQQKQAIDHNASSWIQHVQDCVKNVFFSPAITSEKATIQSLPKQNSVAQTANAEKYYFIATNYANQKNYKAACQYYELAAKLGHAKAQYTLGACYKKGQGVRKDFTQTVFWYKQAADQGLDSAQCYLGFSYEYAQGVDKDNKKAAYYYWLAAKQGHAAAQYFIGSCYHHGKGVTRSLENAIYWYELSSMQEHFHLSNAQYNLGLCYQNNTNTKSDLLKAVYFYEKAAANGHSSAEERLAELKTTVAISKRNAKKAEELYASAYNSYTKNNHSEAAKYYEQSAKLGNELAQSFLAGLYYNGIGVTQNYQTAAYWYKEAALRGNINARYNLGVCYELGRGVPQDYQKAFNCYVICEKHKHEKATERIKAIRPKLTLK